MHDVLIQFYNIANWYKKKKKKCNQTIKKKIERF